MKVWIVPIKQAVSQLFMDRKHNIARTGKVRTKVLSPPARFLEPYGILGLADLADKNTGCTVKFEFEFEINNFRVTILE